MTVPKLPRHNKHVKLKISRLLKQQVIIDNNKVSKIEMMTSLEFYISDQKLGKLIFNSGNDVLKPKYQILFRREFNSEDDSCLVKLNHEVKFG